MPAGLRTGKLSQERGLRNFRDGVSTKQKEYSAFDILQISRQKLECETRSQEPRLRHVVGHIKTWEHVRDYYQTSRKWSSADGCEKRGEQRWPTPQPGERCDVSDIEALPISPMARLQDSASTAAQRLRLYSSADPPFFIGDHEADEEESDEESSEEDNTEYGRTNALFHEHAGEREGNSSQSSLSTWGLDRPSSGKKSTSVSMMKTSENPATIQRWCSYRKKSLADQASSLEEPCVVSLDSDLWACQPKVFSTKEGEELWTEKHWG